MLKYRSGTVVKATILGGRDGTRGRYGTVSFHAGGRTPSEYGYAPPEKCYPLSGVLILTTSRIPSNVATALVTLEADASRLAARLDGKTEFPDDHHRDHLKRGEARPIAEPGEDQIPRLITVVVQTPRSERNERFRQRVHHLVKTAHRAGDPTPCGHSEIDAGRVGERLDESSKALMESDELERIEGEMLCVKAERPKAHCWCCECIWRVRGGVWRPHDFDIEVEKSRMGGFDEEQGGSEGTADETDRRKSCVQDEGHARAEVSTCERERFEGREAAQHLVQSLVPIAAEGRKGVGAGRVRKEEMSQRRGDERGAEIFDHVLEVCGTELVERDPLNVRTETGKACQQSVAPNKPDSRPHLVQEVDPIA